MLSPSVWMNDVPSAGDVGGVLRLAALAPPKSPIAAKENVAPAGAAVRKVATAEDTAPSPTV